VGEVKLYISYKAMRVRDELRAGPNHSLQQPAAAMLVSRSLLSLSAAAAAELGR